MSTTARRTLHIDDPIGGQVCHVAHPGADLEGKLREIPLSEIHPNPNQPRKRIDEAALNALAESIHERGVLQPIIVRPRAVGGFEIVAGERRWRASRLAWQKTIPALVDDEDSDASPLELALIENVVREDLTPIEEARAIATLREDLHITASDLAKRLGRGRADLTHTVRLLDLPDEAIDLIHAGGLTKGHGKALLTEPDHGHRRQLARQAVERGWSVRALEAEIARPPSHARTKPHPDQSAAAIRLEDAVTRALGVDIRARPRGRGFQLLLDQAASTRLLKLLGNAWTIECRAPCHGRPHSNGKTLTCFRWWSHILTDADGYATGKFGVADDLARALTIASARQRTKPALRWLHFDRTE